LSAVIDFDSLGALSVARANGLDGANNVHAFGNLAEHTVLHMKAI
jgi:hypothetical protein